MSATPMVTVATKHPRWRASTAAFALIAGTLAGTVGTAHPARATSQATAAAPADCAPGKNGFVETPRHVPEARAVERVRLPGREVVLELRHGKLNGRAVYWARVLGDIKPADQFWFDWSKDGGRHWIRCGPFRVGSRITAAWTPAHHTNPGANWKFRAGARLVPPNRYTNITRWRS